MVTPEQLEAFDDATTAELARRLEDDDYRTPFDSLKDWQLLRALAIHRPELTLPYHHLVDQEPFDEDCRNAWSVGWAACARGGQRKYRCGENTVIGECSG